MLPYGTRPLPERMLTYHQRCFVAFTWEQFHKKWSWTVFQNYTPRAQWVNPVQYSAFTGGLESQRNTFYEVLHHHQRKDMATPWSRMIVICMCLGAPLGRHFQMNFTGKRHLVSLKRSCVTNVKVPLFSESKWLWYCYFLHIFLISYQCGLRLSFPVTLPNVDGLHIMFLLVILNTMSLFPATT